METKAHQLVLFTSGQVLVFDKNGDQIGSLQAEFVNGDQKPDLLKSISKTCEKFTLSKFREWVQELTKEEFLTITNLR